MRRCAVRGATAFLACAVLGCSPNPTPRGAPPAIAFEACRLKGVETALRCATFDVPEDRDPGANPAGRKIAIRFAVIPALARQPEPDPIFVLAGGPGQAATDVAAQVVPLFAKLNRNRDIVLIDQRGTGGSHRLSCRDETASTSVASSFDAAAVDRRIADCAKRLGAEADLTRYTTETAVKDIDDVRARLGSPRVNLWGASYGTRVALEYLRQFPDRVRTMTLDGIAPASMRLPLSFGVDTRAATMALVAACKAEPACARRFPTLEHDLVVVLERSDGRPIAVTHPLTGATERVTVTPIGLASLLRTPMYIGLTASLLPDAVDRAVRGDFDMLAAMSVTVATGIEDGIALGMHLSVLCSEDMTAIEEADLAAARARATREPIDGQPNPFALVYHEQYRRFCAHWPARRPPPAFFASMRGRPGADVPTLLLSGGIDPATPPRHAAEVATGLTHATALVAPNVGHGVSLQGCAPDLIDRFVRSADATTVDATCLAAIPRPLFLQPVRGVRRDGDAVAVP